MDRFFGISLNGSTYRKEITAGLSTFLTMSFIIAVNPMFLRDAGIPYAAAYVATILATVLGNVIMGVRAN